MNMEFIKKLTIPKEVKEAFPLSENSKKIKEERDKLIQDVFSGKQNKFVLIIGPCSADNEDALLDYICRLRKVQDKVEDKILIIPRIYTNKPRTNGKGYKGMLHKPDPSGKSDLFNGVLAIRHLHMRAIEETGFGCADEMLYPENHRYLNDLLSYVAIGARSVEDQQHRLTASGLNIPVGMKNPTSGDLSVMMNSIKAAQRAHRFIYRGWEVQSKGNEYAHAILRGYVNKHGNALPNYHFEDLIFLCELYEKSELSNPAIIVDVNHSNSAKNYIEQIRIAKEVVHSYNYSSSIRKMLKGLMIESYIEDGAQELNGKCYGKSLTDPCLGWEKSERLILDICDMLK
ncbi:MAG: 3-deoxy-7-phosphoheptulonate synthase [Eubacteriales bacterium]|nr:3-deoxy-7-phosphoheptulonate synthase [Eubacteriales bacterium]